ncbi:hypothetical protein V8E55_005014, partial [Tylopilus felleus]
DLPVDLLINGRWQNDIMPTLLLWAGGNSNVWGVLHGSVAYALPLIVDFHPDGLDSSMMDFGWYSPSVSVAYQRLCDWHHNIASTALAIIMIFFQCASSNIEVRDMADMLLEASAFLYDDLNSSSPKKAFRSHFILQLLHTLHLQYVTGALHTVHCIHPPPPPPPPPPRYPTTRVLLVYVVLRFRTLHLASDGYITIEKLQAFKSNNSWVPKTPLKLNEYSGKESNMAFAFSDQNWGEATRTLTARVEKRTDSEITSIVDAA